MAGWSAWAQSSTNVVSGTISVPGEQDVYTFNVSTNTRFYFDALVGPSGIRWSLSGPPGALVSERAFSSSDAQSIGYPLLHLPAGDYTLTVDGSGDITNAYAFRLVKLADATLVVPGSAVSGSLSPANETDFYQFTAAAGDRFFFDQISRVNLPNTYWRLIDPFGNETFSQGFTDVGSAGSPLTLRVAGTYTLLVEGYFFDTGTGTYSFNISPQGNTPPVPFSGTPFAIGDLVSSNLVANTTNFHLFTLAGPARLLLDNLTNTPSLNWTLEGPASVLVNGRAFNSSDWANNHAPLDLPAGTYQLRVTGTAAQPYRFRLLDLALAAVLTPGQTNSGSLAPATEIDLYRFTAPAGARFLLDALTQSGVPNAYWRLIDPYGGILFNGGLASDQGPLTLTASGTYTLVIDGYHVDSGSGTYSFNVVPVVDGSQALALGSLTTGSVATPGQRQRYSFSLGSSARLYFDSRTNIALRWSLDGPTGNVVNNRPFSSSDGINISYPLLNLPAGDYTLTISGNGDDTGTYQFRLFDLAAAAPLTPGSVVNGTLSPASETDAYQFNVPAPGKYFFDALSLTGAGNSYARLFDPYGNLLFSSGLGSDFGPLTLQPGVHTLLAEGYHSDPGTGTYSFNVTPVPDNTQPLVIDTLVSGSVNVPGQLQRYTFSLAQFARLYFDNLTNVSLRWSLDGPTGNVVNNRTFTSSDAQNIGYPLLNLPAGDYTLTVSGSGDNTGGYLFRLLDIINATPMPPGSTVNGTLAPANETDAYRFNVAAPGKYFFDALTLGGSIGNAQVRLFDSQGSIVFAGGLGSDIGPLTLQPGVHTLLAEGYYNDTGSGPYSFILLPVTDSSQPLTLGAVTSGAVAVPGQVQTYTFSLPDFARLYFDSRTNVALRWSLAGPNGVVINNRSFVSSDAQSIGYPLVNLLAGDYSLTVSGAGDNTGSYQFRLFDLATAAPLTPGTTVNNTLSPANETDAYRFTVVAPGEYFFDYLSATTLPNAYWSLFDSSGTSIFDTLLGNDQGTFLLQPGVYYMLIEGYHSDTGSGTYSINVAPVTDGLQPLSLNTLISGGINTPGQQQRYTFTVSTPSSFVTARLYFDSLTNNSTLRWSLDGPTGNVINNRAFSNSDAQSIGNPLLALPNGAYTLTVFGSGDATGNYSFYLRDFAAAAALTPGVPVSVNNFPANQTALYRFTAAAGDRFFFDHQGSSGLPNMYWRLFDPYNDIVFARGFSSDAGTNVLRAGTYTLLIEGYIGDTGQGSYAFNVRPEGNVPPPGFTGTPITVGNSVTGTLATASTTNAYTFTLGAAVRLLFDSLANFTGNWSLNGPAGLMVDRRSFQTSDSVDSTDALLTLPAGDYQITVTGAAGTFQFRLLDIATATAFTPGSVISNSVSPARATAMYRFAGNAGDKFYFDGRPNPGYSTSPYYRLYSPLGNILFSIPANSDLDTFALPVTGDYTLAVEGRYFDNNAAGTHVFNLVPVSYGTNTLAFGAQINGSIATPGQRQYYTFTLPAETRLYFDALTADDFYWRLDAPRGQIVDWRSFSSSDGADTSNPLLVLPAGDYTLAVAWNNFNGTGNYSFRMLNLASATAFIPGNVVSNTLAPARSTLLYRFTGAPGDKIYFDGRPASGFTYVPLVRIFTPAGDIVMSQSSSSDVDTFTLTQSGTYTVTVEGRIYDNNNSGNFAFNLVPVSYGTNALTIGALVNGAITTPGQRQYYIFNLPSETRLYFDALTGDDFYWRLDAPRGQVVDWRSFSSSDGADINNPMLILPAGSYTLAVAWNNFAGTGSYSFRLLDFNVSPVFTPGNVVSNTLTPGRSTFFHRFTGTAGQQYYFDGLTSSGFTYAPQVRLFGPLNNILFSVPVNANQDTFVLPQSGTYVLTVEGRIYDNNASGGYAFNLIPVTYPTNALTVGTLVSGSIATPGQRQYYTLNLPSDARLYFDSLTNADVYWRLDAPRGQIVDWRSFSGSDGADLLNPLLALPAGNYTLTVAWNGFTGTGDYRFRLLDYSSATPITPGNVVSNTLAPANSTVLYRFTGAAGAKYYFDGRLSDGFTYAPQVRLYGPLGDILFSQTVNSDVDTFTLAQSGTYTLTVEGRIYDFNTSGSYAFNLAPNPDQPSTPLFQTVNSPDLVVTTVSVVPPSGLQSGDAATVQWTLQNAGGVATAGSFTDRVTIRNTATGLIVANSTLAYNEADAGNGPIAPGATRSRQLSVNLPDGTNAVGTLEVTVITDTLNNITEQNTGGTGEANNSTSINISTTLAPYPDLLVHSLTLTPPGGWVPGANVTIQWRLTNSGPRATSGNWTDTVLLRNTNTAQVLLNIATNYIQAEAGNGPIPSGGFRDRSVIFTVPNNANAYGGFEAIVTADTASQIFEYNAAGTAELNNSRTATAFSTPDLLITALNVSANPGLQAGADLTITWNLANQGNVQAEGVFYERIIVRNTNTSEVLLNTTQPYNSALTNSGPIASGASRPRSQTYRLPEGARGSGQIEISVAADAFLQLPEFNAAGTGEANNTTAISVSSVTRPYPDLVVTNIIAPATGLPGQSVPVIWTVRNVGIVPATNVWSDQIFLSADNAIGGDSFVSSLQFTSPLAPGASVTRTQQVTLPVFGTGNRYFVVETDAGNQVFEQIETNNTAIAASPTQLPSTLALSLSPSSVRESAGPAATLVTITRNSDLSAPLLVTLSVSRPDKVIVPFSTVAIPFGVASTNFYLGIRDDSIASSNVVAAISVQAPGHLGATNALTITEDDSPTLSLRLSAASVGENAPAGAVTGTITRNAQTNVPLTVTLVSDRPAALTVPLNVIIPAGQTNASFNLTPVDDDAVTGPRAVSITASAPGYSTVFAPISVLDNDSVALTLQLSDNTVNENAINPASFATLTRSPLSSVPLRVLLGTNGGGLVQVPSEVTIPANQPGVTFNVNVRNDTLAFGAQVVNITAQALAVDGSALPGATASTTVTVFDDDGPTLGVSVASAVIAENGSTQATISRNTPPTNALTVALSALPAGEATFPASVVIPPGASSTNITINGVTDGVTDGAKEVTVTATAAGFNPGNGTFTVTDINVPDLAVVEVSAPTNALTDGLISVVWTVTNSGLATASPAWVDQVYLATDSQGANASPLLSVSNTLPVVVGDSYSQSRSFLLPSEPGTYWVLVRADGRGEVTEGSERNNALLSEPIVVQPSYRATVSTTVDAALSGTPIPLTGRTFFTADGSPAPFRTATVRVNVNRVRRILQVVSDAQGNFATTFQPIPGEAGVYTVGADHPRVRQDPVQDQFTLLGMGAVPWQINQRLAPNVEATGQIEIRNLSPLPLTGLIADSEGLPNGFNLAMSITNTLPGNETVLLDFTLSTTLNTSASGRFTIKVTSAEGAVVRVPVDFVIAPPVAQLVAEPASLNRGMLRGTQTLVQFDVVNQGGASSGDLAVAIPVAPWLSLISTSPIPSLPPGGRSTVVLALNPGTNLPLTTYSGTLAFLGGQSSLGVPFQFRAISDARGDLLITATDEYTYFVNGSPKLTNANIVLRDPVTNGVVAQTLTDTNGQARFTGLFEGVYLIEASAPGHSSTRGTVRVAPGVTTEQEVFLTQQTVRYEWRVVPTEIEDHYRTVIEPLFETEVPQPNLVVENPLIIPLVIPGQVSQFEIRLRNTGLIALDRVRIPVPSHPKLIITPLVTEIERLPAQTSISVPVTIRLADAASAASAGIQFTAASGGACQGTECVIHMPIDTRYKCGPNFKTEQRDVTLQVVCVPDTGCQFDRVDVTRVDFMTANNIAGNAEWDCLLGKMDECQKARVRGYLKFGDFGAVSGPFGDGISDFCACGPPSKIPQLFAAGSNYLSSLGFDLEGFDPAIPSIDFGQVEIVTEVPCNQPFAAAAAPKQVFRAAADPPPGAAVCARVRLQLSQDMTLTRAAFRGTLLLDNNGTGPLTDIQLTVDFRNESGDSVSDLFAVTGPTMSGALTGVGGSGTLAAGGEGSAEYLFIPTLDAAPFSPVTYFVGGTLRYTEDGRVVTIRLIPGVITVLPEPRLTLEYFQQRDVYSDDPFTPELEPAEPFALGLRVRNNGAGLARNFRITSAQPRIIENEKGLLIDFQLLGARVGNDPLNPSFNLNLGNIEPGASKVVIWDMTSTLHGKFIDYRASFEHVDALGSKNLSLIEAVTIHELIHVVRSDRAGDDTLPDFLVNGTVDPDNFPDIVYLSQGTNAPVAPGVNPVVSAPVTSSNLTVQFTVSMPAGFSYVRLPNPGADFRLVSAQRSDGKPLRVGDNIWTTDRTFPASQTGVVREKILHLFDHNSTGSYTLTYGPIVQDTNAPVSAVAALPATSQPSFAVEWNGDDGTNGSGIAYFDIYVSENGGPFTNWLARTTLRSAIFTGANGRTYAFYSRATDVAGNQEIAPPAPDAQTAATGSNTRPNLSAILDTSIDEGVQLSLQAVAVDTDLPRQTLVFSLLAAPAGASVESSTGLIRWQTGEAQGGTTNQFVLVVADNGVPSLSATQSFRVIVREVNNPPIFLNPATDVEVDEQTTLAYTVGAADTDVPANQLTWQLGAGAPSGVTINPNNGLLNWTPNESDGPGEYPVNVTVRDNGAPQQSATRTLRVIVREVNRAPTLAPIPTQGTLVQTTLTVTNSTTDPDLPAQKFFYSLAPGAPRGARIDRTNGVFTWIPAAEYARSTNTVTVRVTDNGVPSLSDSRTFTIIVGDYLEARLGRANVVAGQTSSVPVTVFTTIPATNVSFEFEMLVDRLNNFSFVPPVAPLASSTVQQVGSNRFQVNLRTLPGQRIIGEQIVSHLRFTGLVNRASAFVPLLVTNVAAVQTNGQPVPRSLGSPGRVAYLGTQPLLEIVGEPWNASLVVRGVAPEYTVESTPGFTPPVEWSAFWSGPLSNLTAVIPLSTTNQNRFFRAVEGGATRFMAVSAHPVTRDVSLMLSVKPGRTYVLYRSTDLVQWTPFTTNSVSSNRLSVIDTAVPGVKQRFYRALER